MADKHEQSRGELSIKVNVNVSEALTGLKAIQREARDATKALRELEEQAKNTEVINVLDKDRGLIASIGTEEIIKRKDVTVEIDGKEIVKTAPEHVKYYRKGEGWSNKGSKSNGGVWFDKTITDDIRRSYDWRKRACDNTMRALEDAESSKSITDDIRRSYE